MDSKQSGDDRNKSFTQPATPVQSVKDLVCGMNITVNSAFGKHEYSGRMFYFCSSGCLDKFRSEPSKYALD